MSLPPNPPSVPIFACYCIDFRYDALSGEFLRAIGFENSYFLATNAGAALPLNYKESCKDNGCGCHDKKREHKEKGHDKCCPGKKPLGVLQDSFVTNLSIALTLRPITTVFLLNHQDCGAIRAFLPCSGYPGVGEVKKNKEICINARILTNARDYVKKKFDNITNIPLGLIDVNGTVAEYNVSTRSWRIIYLGPGNDVNGLWFGRVKDEIVHVQCNCH